MGSWLDGKDAQRLDPIAPVTGIDRLQAEPGAGYRRLDSAEPSLALARPWSTGTLLLELAPVPTPSPLRPREGPATVLVSVYLGYTTRSGTFRAEAHVVDAPPPFADASTELRFATAMAAFGLALRGDQATRAGLR